MTNDQIPGPDKSQGRSDNILHSKYCRAISDAII